MVLILICAFMMVSPTSCTQTNGKFGYLIEGLIFILAGISYLSRVQESLARQKTFTPHLQQPSPSASASVADSVFTTRIKSRIQHWRKGCAEPSKTADGRALSINNTKATLCII